MLFIFFFPRLKRLWIFSHDLDKHLQKGLNIKIQLRGSEIVKFEFL